MNDDLRVGIVGGSLGGLFAGVLLHAAGFDVTIFERSRHGLEGRGAGLVGQREIFAILRDVGCEHVAHVGVVATERITLDRAGRIVERHATPQMQISWDRMFSAFRERFTSDRYKLGAGIVRIDPGAGGLALTLAHGAPETFDLVIGADGVGSRVRRRLAAKPGTPTYAGYAAWRGLFPEADLPAEAAAQLLGRFAFFVQPRSHILGYLVTGPDGATEPGCRRYNWVWYRQAPEGNGALAAALTDREGVRHEFSLGPGAMRDDDRAALLAEADATLPPSFAAAVRAEPRPFVQAIFDYASPTMTGDRIALLGDAAFVVRPHTAMGVAKAAGDALSLRDHLVASSDLATALASYDADRQPVGASIAAYGRRLGASLG